MSQHFKSGSQSIGVRVSVSSPSNEYSGLISFSIDCFDLLAVQGTLHSSEAPFLHIQPPLWYNSHIHTWVMDYSFVIWNGKALYQNWTFLETSLYEYAIKADRSCLNKRKRCEHKLKKSFGTVNSSFLLYLIVT